MILLPSCEFVNGVGGSGVLVFGHLSLCHFFTGAIGIGDEVELGVFVVVCDGTGEDMLSEFLLDFGSVRLYVVGGLVGCF